MRRLALAGLTAVLLLAHPAMGPVGADAPLYTVEDLGTIGGFVPTVTGINASGQVSGFVGTGPDSRAVRFMGSSWSYVPGLESVTSAAQAINATGDVTGYAMPPAGLRAFRYTGTTGVLQYIEPLANGSYTYGMAINAWRGGRLRRRRQRRDPLLPLRPRFDGGAAAAAPGRRALVRVRHQRRRADRGNRLHRRVRAARLRRQSG